MFGFKGHKRLISILVASLMVAPSLMAQDNGYNFLDIDIPLEPFHDHPHEHPHDEMYSENLWEVTDEGIYNDEGYQVGEFEEVATLPAAPSSPQVPEVQDSFEDYRQSLINSWGGKKSFAEQRLSGVKENLEDQKNRFEELESKIEEAEKELEPIREQVTALQGQIDLINNQIRFTKNKITNVEVMIAEKQIEIKDSLLFLQRAEVEMDIQKKIVLDYVKLLYEEENKFFDLYDDGSSTLKLLLADASVSENLLGAEYFAIMEQTGRDVFHSLEAKRLKLQEEQDDILKEQQDLAFLYEKLSQEKRSYEESRLSKKQLLEETQGEQERYELLLEEALQQQLEAAIAVQNLQDNLQLIEGKLDILDDGLEEVVEAETVDDLEVSEETIDMMDSVDGQGEEETISGKPFMWPVPANKITAEFQDPTYPKRWGTHNAIDIRAKQYTEVRAPANAYVFQTKDNGLGYSYIVLAHRNNLVTVYGHVSEIHVTPGTTVKRGEVIGLTGGTPGTAGAGLQTTGPHLHFEVYYKGQPVNPLDYLPIHELPIEYVPDEYLHELKQQ